MIGALAPEPHRDALVRARCALSIVHTHYSRAVELAAIQQNPHARARAYAEARRLIRIAVSLHARARALETEAIVSDDSGGRGCPGTGPRSSDPGGAPHLRAA
jgi:hypothetical protein